MTNPLLGKRISLVSKKNIRYEGVLYSINEQNATVALQNVKTFGTEGRETTEEGCIFVAPTDTVHPYLLFRGQDIKDLHVHEPTPEEGMPTEATPPAEPKPPVEAKPPAPPKAAAKPPQPAEQTKTQESTSGRGGGETGGRGTGSNRRTRTGNHNSNAAPGTGASLLNRTARGVVGGDTAAQTPQEDFDFQSSLEKFKGKDEEFDNAAAAYEKDDFFDSISCDALDKESGVSNRLKGADERRLNTETFGAVALNTQRRGGGAGRGGRGRGREGRGGGNGRGRGRGGRGGGRGRGRGRSVASE